MALGVVQGVAHPAAVPDLAAELHRALVALVLDVLLRALEGLVAAMLGALLSAGEGRLAYNYSIVKKNICDRPIFRIKRTDYFYCLQGLQ